MHVSLKPKSRRRRAKSPRLVDLPVQAPVSSGSNIGLPEKFTEVTRWLVKGGSDTSSTCSTGTQGMTTDMLKFLTNKLKSQSLNEGQAYQAEDVADDERDSGTESDDNLDDEYPYNSKSSLTESSQLNNNNREPDSLNGDQSGDSTGVKTHEISEHNFDTVSCTSDYERHSLDFDRHSSEDELITINKENVAKRKWSQVQRCCDSAGSSDEEVKEFLLNDHPVLLSSSPPKGVQKIYSHMPSARQVLARMPPLSVSTVSPRKRHRHNATSDRRFESDFSFSQRPCLDFEKMQQVQASV